MRYTARHINTALWAFSFIIVLTGCSPAFYFNTPNDVLKKKGTVIFNDGSKMQCEITIPFEVNYDSYIATEKYLHLIPAGKAVEETAPLKNIYGYVIDGDSAFYALKKVYLFLDQGDHLLFVKRLTPESSRIQLYYLRQTGRSNPTGEVTEDYFISLPGSPQYETINTHSMRLIPDFNVKMSMFVQDCPALANKILAKAPGYELSFVEFNRFKHRDVFLKIVREYDSCK